MMKVISTILVSLLSLSFTTAQLVCNLSTPIPLNDDGSVTLSHVVNEDANTFSMQLAYTAGQSFVAIGINENGQARMSPSRVILGRADADSDPNVDEVGLYRLRSYAGPEWIQDDSQQSRLLAKTFEQTDTTSTLTFTYELGSREGLEVADDSQWVYAIGFPNNGFFGHSVRGSFQLPLTNKCVDEADVGNVVQDDIPAGVIVAELAAPNRTLFTIHGILMALAWGLCAPMAIASSILRAVYEKMGMEKGTWYKVHFYGNVTTTLLTIAGFIVAIVAKQQQKNDSDGDAGDLPRTTHGKMGIAIFVFCFIQSVAARFRPSLPHAPEPATKEDKEVETSEKDKKPEEAPLEKSTVRVGWEIVHRLMGAALLAMAWYNCHTGIEYSSLTFEGYADWRVVFWVIVGAIAGLTIIGRAILGK